MLHIPRIIYECLTVKIMMIMIFRILFHNKHASSKHLTGSYILD
jgi:hypothetical protein